MHLLIVAILSSIVFQTTHIDLGSVSQDGGAVKFSYVFTNDSQNPLLIPSVTSGCSCMSISYPRELIKAGKTDEITVIFHPESFSGKVTKSITVWGEGNKTLAILSFDADVIPSETSSGGKYLSKELQSSVKEIKYGYVPLGQSSTKSISLWNTTKKDISLEISSLNKNISVNCPNQIGPNQKVDVKVSLSAKEIGRVDSSLKIKTSNDEVEMPLSALVVGSNLNSEVQMITGSSPIKLQRKGDLWIGSLDITNNGKTPLEIQRVQAIEGVNVTPSKATLSKGKKMKITVSSKDDNFSIYIFSNDKTRPCREIRFEK